jgi:hypothetical protein
MKFTVLKATGCAWRGRYLNLNGRQIARITVDPTASRGPTLSFGGGFGNFANDIQTPWLRRLVWITHVVDVRFRLPHVPYRWVCRFPRLLPAYRVSNGFWHGLDGRYQR